MRVTNENCHINVEMSSAYINGLSRQSYMCDLESLRWLLRNSYIIETINVDNPTSTTIYDVMRRVCDNVQIVLNDHYIMDEEPRDIWEYARIMCDAVNAVMCDSALVIMIAASYGNETVKVCKENPMIANSYKCAVIALVCSECCYLSDDVREELEHRAFLYERHAIALQYDDVPDVDLSRL